VVATTVWATTKAARATVTGATRMTATTGAMAVMATTVAMMTPNSDKDNEEGNSKNNGKVTTTLAATTEGGERFQSHRDNCGGGHHRPRDAAIALTADLLQHAFVRSCCFLG
jgi:hypothetical protein